MVDSFDAMLEGRGKPKERRVKPGRFVLGHTVTIEQLKLARAEFRASTR